MFFNSPEYVDQTVGMMQPIDFLKAADDYQPSIGESAIASTATAYDRGLGHWIDNWTMGRASQNALEAGTTIKYKDEQEFQNSQYYAPGMEFFDGLTEERARLMRIEYDKRRRREWILNQADRNGNPWFYMPVNFMAGMVGSVPDPVNIALAAFPVGAAVRGASLAGMTGKQVFTQSLKPGIIGGAVGNLASSSLAAWDLNPQGEHITMQDVLVDTMMGAALGPLFHAGGTMYARRGTRSSIRKGYAELEQAWPDSAELKSVSEALQRNDPAAYRQYGTMLEDWTDNIGRAQDASDYVRNRITPAERMELARWMEYALQDMANGKSVDMAPVMQSAQGLPVLKRFESLVNEYRTVRNETPVVVETVAQAKTEIAALETTLGKFSNEFEAAVSFGQRERHALGDRLGQLKALLDNSKATLAELTDLQNAKQTTLLDIQNAQKQLADTRKGFQAFSDAMRIPESMKVGKDVLTRMENTLAEAQSRLANLETQIKGKLNGETTVAAERIDYRLNDVPTPRTREPLRSMVDRTLEQEIVESGIDPRTGLSETETALGPLNPDEKSALDFFSQEGERINRVEKAVLEDSPFAECIMNAGFLR